MADAAVVIPFRGRWSTLEPLLKALSLQTVRHRLIVVLSVDGTEKPPADIASLTDLVVTGEQGGPAAARNRGWRRADAPLILFTDADCVPEPRWAEELILGLGGEYDGVKGVYSRGGTRVIQRLAQVEFEERYLIMARRESVFLADTYSAGFKKSSLQKLGGFDEGFPFPEHEDVDLSWRLVRQGSKIGFIPGARVAHTHRETWQEYFSLKFRRGKWRVMLVKGFPEMAVNDGYTPQSMKLQMALCGPLFLSLFLVASVPGVFAVLVVLFLLSCLPLVRAAFLTDPGMVPLVVPFAFWRAVALTAGAMFGMLERRRPCSPL